MHLPALSNIIPTVLSYHNVIFLLFLALFWLSQKKKNYVLPLLKDCQWLLRWLTCWCETAVFLTSFKQPKNFYLFYFQYLCSYLLGNSGVRVGEFLELCLQCPWSVVRTEHLGRQPIHQVRQMLVQYASLSKRHTLTLQVFTSVKLFISSAPSNDNAPKQMCTLFSWKRIMMMSSTIVS